MTEPSEAEKAFERICVQSMPLLSDALTVRAALRKAAEQEQRPDMEELRDLITEIGADCDPRTWRAVRAKQEEAQRIIDRIRPQHTPEEIQAAWEALDWFRNAPVAISTRVAQKLDAIAKVLPAKLEGAKLSAESGEAPGNHPR